MGSGTDEGTGRGVDAAPGDNSAQYLADLLAQLVGVVSTQVARGAYAQVLATLVASGSGIDEAATMAMQLVRRADLDILEVRVSSRPISSVPPQ